MVNNKSQKKVLIFRDTILPYSETFIKNQSETTPNTTLIYCGLKAEKGLDLFGNKILLTDKGILGKLKRYFYIFFRFDYFFFKRIRNEKIDLIHSHFGVDATLINPFSLRYKTPHVVTFHGYDAFVKKEFAKQSFLAHRLYHNRLSELFASVDKILAVSTGVKKALIKLGVPKDKIIIHYIGVDINKFKPSEVYDNRVVFVGRLVEKKGPLDLINAFIRAKPYLPDNTVLEVIGDGPLMPEIKKIASNKKNKIIIRGKLPQKDVYESVSTCAVFSLPSKTAVNGDSEGLPISILEAMSCGKAIISTRHSGIPDAVEENVNGFLVDEGDVDGIYHSLIELMNDKSKIIEYGRNSRQKVVEKFNLSKQSIELSAIYDRAIEDTFLN